MPSVPLAALNRPDCPVCLIAMVPCKPTQHPSGQRTRLFKCRKCKRSERLVEQQAPVRSVAAKPVPAPAKKKPAAKGGNSGVVIGQLAPLNIPIPAHLLGFNVSPKSLASGAYAKKVVAWFASYGVPHSLKDLMEQSASGKTAATVKLLEIFKILETPKGVSILNDNRSVTVNADGGSAEGGNAQRRSFEQIARQLESSRDRRIAEGNPLAARVLDAQFVETPEGTSK